MIKGLGIAKAGTGAGGRVVAQWSEQQIYYVGKHGSDLNSGKSINKAVLTIGRAIYLINLQTPSPTNRFKIEITDAGSYVESSLIIPAHTDLIGVSATASIRILTDGDVIVLLKELIVADTSVLSVTAVGDLYVYSSKVSYTHSKGFSNRSPSFDMYFEVSLFDVNISHSSINNVSTGNVYLNINKYYFTNDFAFLNTNAGSISGYVGEISDDNTGIALKNTGAGEINIKSNKVDCSSFAEIDSGTITLDCVDISGSFTKTGGTLNIIPEKVIQFACSDEESDLEVKDGILTFLMPYNMTLLEVRANVKDAPTGSNMEIDVNEDGVSIFSTKISIDDGEKTSETSSIPYVLSNINLQNESQIVINMDKIGSTVAGVGLKMALIGY